MDGQGTKGRRKIAENVYRLSEVHQRYRQTDRQTDETAIAYSERERLFTFAKNRYISRPLLRLNSPTEGFPWDDLRKIFSECQLMAKVSDGEEKLPKISTG